MTAITSKPTYAQNGSIRTVQPVSVLEIIEQCEAMIYSLWISVLCCCCCSALTMNSPDRYHGIVTTQKNPVPRVILYVLILEWHVCFCCFFCCFICSDFSFRSACSRFWSFSCCWFYHFWSFYWCSFFCFGNDS